MRRKLGKPKKRFSCDGKTGKFVTKELAWQSLLAMTRRTGTRLAAMEVYRCQNCWVQVAARNQRPYHFGHRR